VSRGLRQSPAAQTDPKADEEGEAEPAPHFHHWPRKSSCSATRVRIGAEEKPRLAGSVARSSRWTPRSCAMPDEFIAIPSRRSAPEGTPPHRDGHPVGRQRSASTRRTWTRFRQGDPPNVRPALPEISDHAQLSPAVRGRTTRSPSFPRLGITPTEIPCQGQPHEGGESSSWDGPIH